MPKIQISKKYFYSMISHALSLEEIEKLLESAKAEIDGVEDDLIKIEFNDTNRPDLWSTAGLSRLVNTLINQTNKSHNQHYSFFNKQSHDRKYTIEVDPDLLHIRPYVCGFIASGKAVDNDMLVELIQTQEKLGENFGKKRQSVSIGIYREDLIQWPVQYVSADPHTTSFVPLDYTEAIPLSRILQEHPKGKDYGNLISQFEKYPLLLGSDDKVLSMPPIINSAHIGAVKVGDTRLFFECTGYNLEQLMLTLNIMACDCFDMGFDITPVVTQYPFKIQDTLFSTHIEKRDNTYCITAPVLFQNSVQVSLSEITKLLGETFSIPELQQILDSMGVSSHSFDNDKIEITVPAYRNDFLHSVDIIEEIMIGKGIHHFTPEYPKTYTIGRLTEIEKLCRKTISLLVGLGFQEMIFPYLGSWNSFVEKLYPSEEWDSVHATMVQIANPISDNYEYVRSSILPNLLEAECVSAHSPYPHRMCEIGKTATQNKDSIYGTCTNTKVAFLIADSIVSFTDVNSIVNAILYYLDIPWHVSKLTDSRFIEGRCGNIIINNSDKNIDIEVGVFGEIHPRILQEYNITMPCVAGEILLDKLL